MAGKNVYIFLFDGFADWEIAYVSPHIRQCEKYDLSTFSLNGQPVRSMGGLHIAPNTKLADLDFKNMAMLILPGGDAWERKELREVIPAVQKAVQGRVPVAAICAATTLFADIELLDSVKHTSNSKQYLTQLSPGYMGQHNYQGQDDYSDPIAVTDSNIITASGVAPLEFANGDF